MNPPATATAPASASLAPTGKVSSAVTGTLATSEDAHLAPVELTPRAKRQRIGALLLAYGVAEAALLGWLSLMGLHASDGREPWLRPTS